jgi:FKBP-type peptidyl-prolyl cis-trans isomerase FkpA
LCLASAAVLGGCLGSDSPTEVVFEVIEETTFATSLGIDLAQMTELPSGVYIQDLVVGTGDVIAEGDDVSIDHTGWLRSGVEFSSGQFQFVHRGTPGMDVTVIEGFDIGMEGMAVGGTRRIIIPPELAYGAQGATNQLGQYVVPPGAIVIFEVELLSIP